MVGEGLAKGRLAPHSSQSRVVLASTMNTSRSSIPKVLIADDQQDVIEALRLLLKGEGFHIDTAASPDQIMSAVETRDFDVALIDLNYTRDTTSGQEGLDLLTRMSAVD